MLRLVFKGSRRRVCALGRLVGAWWRKRVGDDRKATPWSAEAADTSWRAAPRQLGYWENWGVPELADYNGMLWYRTHVTLTAKQASQAATLSLGRVDEVDQSWVNGRPVRLCRAGQGQNGTYQLPVGSLKAGDNVDRRQRARHVWRRRPAMGRWRAAQLRFADGDSALLDGEWRYRMPPQDIGSPPRAPWEAAAGLSVIHNAMIAPLAGFGLRGVVWYQGESNTSEAARYQDLLAAFLADWRSSFGADLPFLIVQLANYGAPPTAPARERLGKPARSATLASSRRTSTRARGRDRYRRSLRHSSRQQAGGRPSSRARCAPRGLRRSRSHPRVPFRSLRAATAAPSW